MIRYPLNILRLLSVTLTLSVFLSGCFAKTNSKKQGVEAVSGKHLDQLRVGTLFLPHRIDPAKVRSVSLYVVLAQTGRSLISLAKDAQIQGDLASSWESENDSTVFSFRIRENQRFSDGTVITSDHIVCSIERQRRLNIALHFDFESIKSISASENQVRIVLAKSNPRFLQQLGHPEFFALTKENCNRGVEEIDLSVSSGPYSVALQKPGYLELVKNEFFDSKSSPTKVKIYARKREELNKMLLNNQFDFCMDTGQIDRAQIKTLASQFNINTVVPHIGFTYWLSINEHNSDLSDIPKRYQLMDLIHSNISVPENYRPYWSKADQMYLPDGNGRLNRTEINQIWQTVKSSATSWPKGSKINLLLRLNFKFQDSIVSALTKAGFKVDIDTYSSLKEFEEKSINNRSKYHLVQINNDYSAVDLYENLKVTFNPVRPLVLANKSQKELDKLMEKAKISKDIDEAYEIYKKIERLLLVQGLIVPIAYNHMVFFVSDEVDISRWSSLYPEVSFWKVKPKS